MEGAVGERSAEEGPQTIGMGSRSYMPLAQATPPGDPTTGTDSTTGADDTGADDSVSTTSGDPPDDGDFECFAPDMERGVDPGRERRADANVLARSEEGRIASVLHHLGPAARAILEKLISTTNYQFQSEFAQKYFFEGKHEGKEEGELKGEAKMLLRIIDRRGVAISSHDRERVMSCAGASQIEAWADRALTATTRDEIFES